MKYLTNYLPIKDPLEYEPKDTFYFYKNIVKPLIEDLNKIMNNGIPIDLNKVEELNKNIENNVNSNIEILHNNPIIKKFIVKLNEFYKKDKIENIKNTIKTKEDFIVKFNGKQSHVNFLIDIIVETLQKQNKLPNNYNRLDTKTNWTTSKLKHIYNLTSSVLIQDVLDKNYNSIRLSGFIDKAVDRIAETKYKAYLKTLDQKIIDNSNKEFYNSFNPSSPTQLQQLFSFIGLKSRYTTKTNNESFNKDALKELLEDVNNRIYQLENINDKI